MTVVQGFTERRTAALKQQDDLQDIERFKRLLSHCTKSEAIAIVEAVRSKDQAAYMELIKPVVMRMAIIEVNEKIKKGEIEL